MAGQVGAVLGADVGVERRCRAPAWDWRKESTTVPVGDAVVDPDIEQAAETLLRWNLAGSTSGICGARAWNAEVQNRKVVP